MNSKESHANMLIDAGILCGITALMAMNGTFGGDEAAKFIDAKSLFWAKSLCGWSALTLQVLKSFRSTSFAHDQNQKAAENGQSNGTQTQLTTQITQPPPVITTAVTSTPANATVPSTVQPIT